MPITLIPHTYSIEVQISDYTLRGHRQSGFPTLWYGQKFMIEYELEDSVYYGGYHSTLQQFYFQLYVNDEIPVTFYVPEDKPLHFFLYPCRPGTEYHVYTGDQAFTDLGAVTTLPENSEYIRTFNVSEKISFADSEANAEIIRNYLTNEGWSPEAIAGVLGLAYCQSGLNPANQGYYYDGTPYSVNAVEAIWCTNTTLLQEGAETIPYQTDITQTPPDPYWLYGEKPVDQYNTPTWAGIASNRKRAAISMGGDGFGLFGIMPFDRYLLYPQSTELLFPAGNYWSGEGQLHWLDIESRFNYLWNYSIRDSDLPQEFRATTFREYRELTEEPEIMAHIFLAHKADYIVHTTYNTQTHVDEYARTLECAKQWARYFYKKPVKKRKGMPIWEYLRYTI